MENLQDNCVKMLPKYKVIQLPRRTIHNSFPSGIQQKSMQSEQEFV